MPAPYLFQDLTLLVGAACDAKAIAHLARSALKDPGFIVRSCDPRKPWGAEIKLRGNPERAMKFLQHFFGDLEVAGTLMDPVTPKILLIAQAQRLSWHVHERKDAHLRVLHGQVGVSLSTTDTETAPRVHSQGAYVHVPPLMRHRLSSLSGWAVVAEIGRDIVPEHPSDDEDTRRIQDDYGR
jgi:mannose-6-phosphate isomerase-like protein (cupin superfamily)